MWRRAGSVSPPAPHEPPPQTDTAVRMAAQEGLAIALASNVLVTQVDLLEGFKKVGKCVHGKRGFGSAELISEQKTGKNAGTAEAVFYFDTACQTPYIDEKAALSEAKSTIDISATETFTGLQGQSLGSMSLSESARLGSKIVLIGLGKFTPANGAPAVSLGLTCTITAVYKCEGGIAQSFPNLNESLASVTPLTLTFSSGNDPSVTFKGADPNRQTGPLGALSIDELNGHALGISGAGSSYGKAITKGRAAELALFPSTPTSWDVADMANGVKFSIKVVNDKTRDVTGTVTSLSDGATLATIAADQSGTGSIAYTGEETDAITSWLLAD